MGRVVSEREYKEPTNEQLANFLVVYAQGIPQLQNLQLNPVILEMQLRNSVFREAALKHHRGFCREVDILLEKVDKGELQCEHIRLNGKRCPNHNEPGNFYCGLHKGEENEESHGGSAVA